MSAELVKAPPSLKARALQMLAQREQSRVELRRKLLDHANAEDARAAETIEVETSAADATPDARVARPDASSRVDAVLEWLESNRYASDERFAESRVNARASRFGNLRIHQELKQHAVSLTPEAVQSLKDSELARAVAVHERRFASAPSALAERAKQARFLAARGFSSDVIQRVLRRQREEGSGR